MRDMWLSNQITHILRNFSNFDPKTNKGFNEAPIWFLGAYSMALDTLVRHWERGIRHILGPSSSRLTWLVGYYMIRTDHRNLLFTNNHGSRKVLEWKLDIHHYDATIEHAPGKANIHADVFSRFVVRTTPMELYHIWSYSAPQRNM